MPAYEKTQSGFTMYTPQKEFRQTFSHFYKAGIDAFASVASQNPDGYFNLDNVMPAVSGGFVRRWGTSSFGTTANFSSNLKRFFPYQVSAQGAVSGVFYSGFSDYYALMATDGTKISPVYSEGTLDSQALSGFSGDVYGVVSRGFFYGFDGANPSQKRHFAKGDTTTNTGIATPTGVSFSGLFGSGIGYHPATTTAEFTASTTPIPIALTFDANGSVTSARLTGVGTGAIGSTTYYIEPTDTDSTPGHDCVIAVTTDSAGRTINSSIQLIGPIVLNKGRLYSLAYHNSKTGHTSDPVFDTVAISGSGGFGSGQGTQIELTLTIPLTTDPQVDKVIVLATADGGDRSHLYEVTQIPLSSFTVGSTSRTYIYADRLPDTIGDNPSGVFPPAATTLLEQNLWVDVDAAGNTVGIIDNTPPTTDLTKPVSHQGRLFATNGKSLFFSKSIEEVTTSTGLITGKWEEAWPSNFRIDIGFDNELIVGLLSDGTFLYIGTTKNIYRLAGTNIDNFSLEAIFKNVGLKSQDAWTVVYKEQLPAGYMWLTPDAKVMFSDFNNYEDVGTPIYPYLTNITGASIQPWVNGPYALAVLRTAGSDTFVYNLDQGGWYRWQPAINPGPQWTYTSSSGLSKLFFANNTGGTPVLGCFDPAQTTDAFPSAGTLIPWTIRTGWVDLGEPAGLKVINELECWTGAGSINTKIYYRSNATVIGATERSQSKTTIPAPIDLYSNLQKAYYAALPVTGRTFSFEFSGTGPAGNAFALDQFIVSYFPFGRF